MKSFRLIPSRTLLALVLASGGLMAVSVNAGAQTDDASLARGAVPDTTPQQRYQSAIREAGGGLKVSLEECRGMAASDRKGCESQARARYRSDMASAKALLSNPSAGPVNIVGEPIRSTEITYVVKP